MVVQHLMRPGEVPQHERALRSECLCLQLVSERVLVAALLVVRSGESGERPMILWVGTNLSLQESARAVVVLGIEEGPHPFGDARHHIEGRHGATAGFV